MQVQVSDRSPGSSSSTFFSIASSLSTRASSLASNELAAVCVWIVEVEATTAGVDATGPPIEVITPPDTGSTAPTRNPVGRTTERTADRTGVHGYRTTRQFVEIGEADQLEFGTTSQLVDV